MKSVLLLLLLLTLPVSSFSLSPTFGRVPSDPVRLVSIDAEYAYLERLETLLGEPVRALRWGSFYEPGFDGPMDRWSVEQTPGVYVDLYFYGYGPTNTLVAPIGFQLDSAGMTAAFRRFRVDRPSPRRENERGPDPDARAGASIPIDKAECVMVGPVLLPPPAGFVNLRLRPALYSRFLRKTGGDKDYVAVFGKISPDDELEAFTVVHDSGNGGFVSLAEFDRFLASRRSALYDRGTRAGVFAPHRITRRSLQWTVLKSYFEDSGPDGGGQGILVSSHGHFWLRGRAFGLTGPALDMPATEFRMGHIESARRMLEDWEDRILRANGIDPACADLPSVMGDEALSAAPSRGTEDPILRKSRTIKR